MSAVPQQPPLIASSLRGAVVEAREIIQAAREQYPHVAVVAIFSGGNDSTTALHLVRDEIDFALHIHTGIGVEETRDFVRQTAADWGVRLVEKKTDPDVYREDVLKRGFPGPMQHRVMYSMLKERMLREVGRELKTKRGQKMLLLTGERAHESKCRLLYGATTTRPFARNIWVNPIHHCCATAR